jgi:integrase
LQWSNVDVDAGTLKVCESIVEGVHAKRTKTNEDRIVTYLEPLVPILREWHARNGKPKSGFVIKGQTSGGPLDLNRVADRIIYPVCEHCGLGKRWKGTAFYGLRRGCGTLLVQTGSSIEQGAKFLGNTAAVFEENYWVDKGEMAAQASDNYTRDRRARLEKESKRQEEEQQKQLTNGLAELGLAEAVVIQ